MSDLFLRSICHGIELSQLHQRSIYLQLSEGETTASTNTAVVLDGRAPDNGTQLVDGARSNGGGLGDTGLTTAVLAAGLKSREKKRMLVDQVLSSKKIFPFNAGRSGVGSFSGKRKEFSGSGIVVVPGRSAHAHDAANPCGSLLKLR